MASVFETFGNGNTPVRVERDGVMLYVPFRELRGGDKVCHRLPDKREMSFTVDVDGDAHLCDDTDNGEELYVVYDENGDGYYADMITRVTKVINAVDRDGLNVNITTMVFSIPYEDFDLEKAIRDAAVEFCHTKDGLDMYEHNCGEFNYGDFLNVPNEICTRHGFELMSFTYGVSEVVDFNTTLVFSDDVYDADEDDEDGDSQ